MLQDASCQAAHADSDLPCSACIHQFRYDNMTTHHRYAVIEIQHRE